MNNDNVRLALIISGIWGGIIIVIVGIEAIVHDGDVAKTIVDTYGKVLLALAGSILGVIGMGKFFDARVATSPFSTPAAAAPLSSSTPSDPTNDTAGASAVAVAGDNT